MKKLLLLLIIIPFFASSQPNYTRINSRYNWLGVAADQLHVPAGATAALGTGQWVRAGALYVDTTGGDKGLYYYVDGVFIRLYDTADAVVSTSGQRFGVTGEDARATATRYFSFGNNSFTIDSANQYFTAVSTQAGSQFTVTRGGTIRFRVNSQGTSMWSSDGSSSQIQTTNTQAYVNSSNQTYIASPKHTYIFGGDSVNVGSGGVYPVATSYVSVYPHRVYVSSDSNITIGSVSADQYADDSLVWRTTSRNTHLSIYEDSMSLWQTNGEYYVYNLKRASSMADKGVMVWDSVASEWEFIDADSVGGGGAATGWDDMLSVAQSQTTNRTIDGASNNLTFQSFGTINSTATNFLINATTVRNTATNFEFDALPSLTDAADSMVVWNASSLRMGKRPIGWGTLGNVANGNMFLGPTTNNSLRIYTNNTYRGRWDSTAAMLLIGSPTFESTAALNIQSLNNTAGKAVRAWAANLTTYSEWGYGAILNPGAFSIQSSSLTTLNLASGKAFIGGSTTPTAWAHIAASTTAANTASIKIIEGSRQTTPEDGTLNYVANNLEFTETSTVHILAKTLTATATLDFGNTAAGTSTDLTITVTGAALGDAVYIGAQHGSVPDNGVFFGWVSSTNTVTVRFANNDLTDAKDPASGTFRAVVTKY